MRAFATGEQSSDSNEYFEMIGQCMPLRHRTCGEYILREANMNTEEVAQLRATISALVEKSNTLRLELDERLISLDKVRIAMRRLQRALAHPRVN
jgi:hypothetical protein